MQFYFTEIHIFLNVYILKGKLTFFSGVEYYDIYSQFKYYIKTNKSILYVYENTFPLNIDRKRIILALNSYGIQNIFRVHISNIHF